MNKALIDALNSLKNIVDDQHKLLIDHERRIGMLETKLQVFAKVSSGVDLNKIEKETLGKKEATQ
tara:strand:+ start:26 stop:220 length:195 start_codon:yes stop_codon:yes gene_type:complete